MVLISDERFLTVYTIFRLQRESKYKDSKLKALKSRNEYLLCLDAANAAVNKYYRDDLPNLVDVSV